MYFLRARYLNPGTGRFWTMDAFEGGSSDSVSLHKYLYTNNDPINRWDPSGHFSLTEALIVVAIDFQKKIS
jgi:RHS repeat-associated protein